MSRPNMHWFRARWPQACIASIAVALLVGCGGEEGVDVSGKVTFKGEPIPQGKILFIPDGAKENSGATGYATIENGTYDTSAEGGKPATPGPVIVGIEGFDPNASAEPEGGDTSGEELVVALFPYYEMQAEIPDEATSLDFDVPPEAAERKTTGEQTLGGGGGGYINP